MQRIGKILIIPVLIGSLTMSLSALGSLDCCANIPAWKNASPMQRFIVIAPFVLGGATLCYYLINREESSEKLYTRARFLYEEVFEKYNRVGLLHNQQLIKSVTEQELALLTPYAEIQKLTYVASDLQRLKETKDALQARIARDTRKGVSGLSEMHNLLRETKSLITDLEKLAEFWNQHGVYFSAYNTIRDIADHYKHVRLDLNNHDLVRRAIMSLAVTGHVAYPYLSFASTVKNDIDKLTRCIQITYRYMVLHSSAQALHSELTTLLGIITTFPEYMNEMHLKQQHQLEQERIAIEKQKVAAERAKADAMAEKAAAERAKANAMYQQAAAERQKAQAMQQQAIAQLAQSAPQININLQPPAQAAAPVEGPKKMTTSYATRLDGVSWDQQDNKAKKNNACEYENTASAQNSFADESSRWKVSTMKLKVD